MASCKIQEGKTFHKLHVLGMHDDCGIKFVDIKFVDIKFVDIKFVDIKFVDIKFVD